MKTVASVKRCVQVSPDDWVLREVSKVFNEQATLLDVRTWADSIEDGTSIADIRFSNYDGEYPEPPEA